MVGNLANKTSPSKMNNLASVEKSTLVGKKIKDQQLRMRFPKSLKFF